MTCLDLSQAIEGIERDVLSLLEDADEAGHPISPVGKNEVPHDAKGCPGVLAFVLMDPEIW